MKTKIILLIFVLISASLLTGCPANKSSSSSGGGSLEGNWYGVVGSLNSETSTFNTPASTIGVTVNADNTATNEKIGGAATGVTYTIVAVPNQTRIYSYTGSDGSRGGFYVDSSYTHAVYLGSDLTFSVVQKGASSLPTFSFSDVTGSWSGFSVETDSSLNIIDTYPSSATVASNGTFSGSNKYGEFTGHFNGIGDASGRALGSFTSTSWTVVQAWISADKAFAGTFACTDYVSLSACAYSAWNKQ